MIPNWNTVTSALPPVRPGQEGHSPDRSPYKVPLIHVIDRFGITPERRSILAGFLAYRKALHAAGLTSGFQWLNGSFIEDKESLKSESPNDIDVVTFYYLPNGTTQQDIANKGGLDLFDSAKTKPNFHVDAYPFQLGRRLEEPHVRNITYWYSMWSHRRETLLWKGIVQVDLSPADDAQADDLLKQLNNEETKQ